jgi:FdhD protein
MQPKFCSMTVETIEFEQRSTGVDNVVLEEPLEIRLVHGPEMQRKTRSLAVTMRTPGDDFELAVGFLISEGIVRKLGDIRAIRFLPPFLADGVSSNLVEVELDPGAVFEPSKLQRHFYMTSSCGICGKTSLDAIRADQVGFSADDPDVSRIASSLISSLPNLLRERQTAFQLTGGLHGAGLVTTSRDWIAVREDVGRHNAVDKLVGSEYLADRFPVAPCLLVLSGRASFELVQKALLARIRFVVAVGAPSSLAVELAQAFDLTLVGFTSTKRFNVYSGGQRIVVN